MSSAVHKKGHVFLLLHARVQAHAISPIVTSFCRWFKLQWNLLILGFASCNGSAVCVLCRIPDNLGFAIEKHSISCVRYLYKMHFILRLPRNLHLELAKPRNLHLGGMKSTPRRSQSVLQETNKNSNPNWGTTRPCRTMIREWPEIVSHPSFHRARLARFEATGSIEKYPLSIL